MRTIVPLLLIASLPISYAASATESDVAELSGLQESLALKASQTVRKDHLRPSRRISPDDFALRSLARVPALIREHIREHGDYAFEPRRRREIRLELARNRTSWIDLPEKGVAPLLSASAIEMDYAPIENGFAMLTFSGKVTRTPEGEGRGGRTAVFPYVSLLDKDTNLLAVYAGAISEPSSKRASRFFAACEYDPKAQRAVLGFSDCDWGAVPTVWKKRDVSSEELCLLNLNAAAFAKLQGPKAEKEHASRVKAAAKWDLKQAARRKKEIVDSMDLVSWFGKDGVLLCRAEFQRHERGVVYCIDDDLSLVEFKVVELDRESQKTLRRIVKAKRAAAKLRAAKEAKR